MTVNIILNGKSKTLSEKVDLFSLMKSIGLSPQNIVAELNGDIIEKKDYDSVYLNNNDRLELIRFMGGGCSSFLNKSEYDH